MIGLEFSVFDVEADELLDKATHIHCLCYETYKDGNLIEKGQLTDYNDIIEWLHRQKVLVGHNIIRYDIPLLEKLLRIKISASLVDTLPLSWYLYPDRKKHGLEEWGLYFGIPKPEVIDWTNAPIEVYLHRCSEDVKINSRLAFKQLDYLNKIYEGKPEGIIRYLMFKMDCAREQEEVKWKLDRKKCEETLEMFKEEFNRRVRTLSEIMPENIKYRSMNPPKKPRKKDGSLSSVGQRWQGLLEELGLPSDYNEPIKIEKEREPGNPNSHVQVKAWLHQHNWEPETYKYKRDKDTGEVSRIEQISLPFGQGICPSVKKLYEIEPALENLEAFYVISHRIGVLEGFLRDADENNFLKAEVAGLTNTLRFKHTTLVNLPGYTGTHKEEEPDWKDGVHIRGCLVAPSEDYVLCGSDMSSLEDRTKQHYMYYFDPDYVETMIKPGFDPHLDLAEFAYDMTDGELGLSPEDVEFYKNFSEDNYTQEEKDRYNKIKKERHSFKTVNYAAVYGSGAATMSRSSGMSIERCEVLLLAYWGKNWSVKSISKQCIVKVVDGQMWLYNPVSTFWYTLRYEKDKFSTLNQGTGVYCFDNWVNAARSYGLKMCGQFHDEVITPVKRGKEEETEEILKKAIRYVNNRLKLNRELDVDVQFGHNYAQIH